MKGRLASAALLGTLLVILTGCLASPPDAGPGAPEPMPEPGPGAPGPMPDPSPADPLPVDPVPTIPPPAGGPDDGGEVVGGGPEDAVVAFQERCAQGVEDWRGGRVDYPDRMGVTIEVGANYNAAIDVRSEPLPPDEVVEVDNGTATSEAVLVKCTVAARLTAVGEALEVDEPASGTDAGWVLQEFTPSGVIEWSWTVTAHKPVDEQLRLELRPAVVVDAFAGDLEYAGKNVSSFTTDVHVDASALHHAAYWVDVNRPLIWTIGSALGAAVLAVIVWWRKVRSPRKATSEAGTAPPPAIAPAPASPEGVS